MREHSLPRVVTWVFYLALVLATIFIYDRVRTIQAIHHPIPALQANTTGLAEAGPALQSLGCARVEPDDFLGGLPYPLVWCWRTGYTPQAVPYFRERGCLVRSYVGLVMLKDGRPRLVEGTAELRATFAPIDSYVQALSYAIASTPYHASPTESFVDERADGYAVRLYSDLEPPCGCGEHKSYAVDVLVTRDGGAREIARQVARQIQACID